MSNEIKQASFRFGSADIEKFRAFAEEHGMNQAEMFQSMLNAFELAQAKTILADRGKEIETFQATVNVLTGMFVNSLAVSHSSEARTKEEMAKELNAKDATISDLQVRIRELTLLLSSREQSITALITEKDQLRNRIVELTDRIAELKEDIRDKNGLLADAKVQRNILATMLDEYKPYKDECKARIEQYQKVKNELDEARRQNKFLSDQLMNEKEAREFYQKATEKIMGDGNGK